MIYSAPLYNRLCPVCICQITPHLLNTKFNHIQNVLWGTDTLLPFTLLPLLTGIQLRSDDPSISKPAATPSSRAARALSLFHTRPPRPHARTHMRKVLCCHGDSSRAPLLERGSFAGKTNSQLFCLFAVRYHLLAYHCEREKLAVNDFRSCFHGLGRCVRQLRATAVQPKPRTRRANLEEAAQLQSISAKETRQAGRSSAYRNAGGCPVHQS